MLAQDHHHGDDPHASTTGLSFDTLDVTRTPGDVGQDDSIRVFNPDAIVDGKSIAQWTENWWQWALQAPAGNGPLDSSSPEATHFNNNGKIFFIAGGPNATITVPMDKPILFPMINAFDTEGPGIETIPGFQASGRGSFADEAKFVTNLEQNSIYDAFATITTPDGRTLLDIQWPKSSNFVEQSGIFAIGEPQPGSYIANLLDGADISEIPNLPFTRSTGDWLMLKPLPPGTYTFDFGGNGHAVTDPVTGTSILPEGWGTHTTDTIVVGSLA
jgi:hypothetical protein